MEITKVVKPNLPLENTFGNMYIYGLHRKSNQKIIQNALISIYVASILFIF